MRTIRRFIYREVVVSVAFVTLAFLALFFFFDLLDEMRYVGRYEQYGVPQAMLVVLLTRVAALRWGLALPRFHLLDRD